MKKVNSTEAKKMLNKLSEHAKNVKSKYDNLEEPQKKKILAGVAGALSALAAVGIMAKAKKSLKRKKKEDIEE